MLLSRFAAVERLPDLEQRHIDEPPRLIARGGPQQAGQQVWAQMAHV